MSRKIFKAKRLFIFITLASLFLMLFTACTKNDKKNPKEEKKKPEIVKDLRIEEIPKNSLPNLSIYKDGKFDQEMERDFSKDYATKITDVFDGSASSKKVFKKDMRLRAYLWNHYGHAKKKELDNLKYYDSSIDEKRPMFRCEVSSWQAINNDYGLTKVGIKIEYNVIQYVDGEPVKGKRGIAEKTEEAISVYELTKKEFNEKFFDDGGLFVIHINKVSGCWKAEGKIQEKEIFNDFVLAFNVEKENSKEEEYDL